MRSLLFTALLLLTFISLPALAQQKQTLQSAVNSAVGATAKPAGDWTSTAPAQPQQPAATETLGRGSLPGEKIINLPPATKAELAEAAAVEKMCADGVGQRYYDCECTSMAFLQMRVTERASGKVHSDGYQMRLDAQKACTNTPALAGYSYNICMSWAPRMHENYEELCSCYASTYAQKFGAAPTDSFQVNQRLVSAALKACNAGQSTLVKLERQKRIRDMKRDGSYDQLFPSAKESGLATTLPEKQPVLSTTPPALRLTDQILGPGTEPRIPDRQRSSGQ